MSKRDRLKKAGHRNLITVLPGIHVLTEIVSVSDLRGQAVVRPTLRTFNEELDRSSKALRKKLIPRRCLETFEERTQ